MNLVDLYKSILDTAGMSADAEGFVSFRLAKTESKPVIVAGKRLVLPTRDQLAQGDFQNRIVFHPLTESIVRGESEVLSAFRERLNSRMNFILGCLSIRLMTIGTSTAMHAGMSPDQTEFLSAVKSADEGTIRRLTDIAKKLMVGDTNKAFAHMYVRRNVTHGGKKHLRLGVVGFPLYEELCKVPAPKTPNEVYGVELRKADRAAIKGLIEYILPDVATPEAYYSPSNSTIAPTTDALMKTVIKLGDQINTVVELFGKLIDDDYESLLFNGDWEETFKDLTVIDTQIKMIPVQAGNEGRSAPEQSTNAISMPAGSPATPVVTQAAPATTLTMQPPPGVVVSPTSPVVTGAVHQQPQGQHYHYQQPVQQQVASDGLVRTPNGVVYDSVTRRNAMQNPNAGMQYQNSGGFQQPVYQANHYQSPNRGGGI